MSRRLSPALALLVLLGASAACTRQRPDCARAASVAAALDCQARTGDQLAQLELGRRYETGVGVPRDLRRAAGLYRQAATFRTGTTYVYSPPVGKARGSIIPVRIGPDLPGLAEAKYRLALLHLRGTGVRFDLPRARKLLEEASGQGFGPAAAKLRELDQLPTT